MNPSGDNSLKGALARTIKWNIIDRVGTQVLYAVTGIVLARMLSQEDFGLVGAILVFQAFAQLFVDSGFSSALIQRKSPTTLDYSTVFWFNLTTSAALYVVLWFCAPPIDTLFHAGGRLVAPARVMFLTIVLNALSIVQANRLTKLMTVKLIAIANSAGLTAGAIAGIWLAINGYGVWAIIAQAIANSVVKAALLWWKGGWKPECRFSSSSLRDCFNVGMGVMASSFLNTVFQNIYSYIIGHRVGLVALGYFTQADKWSKMGVSSLSQVLTSSFLPVLSRFQNTPGRFAEATTRMNRLTAYMLFPAMGLTGMMATSIFHTLFGTKWDPAITLFQILLARGVFTVLTSLYNNYILALGRSKALVITEALRDCVAIAAIALTLPYIALSDIHDPTEGIRIFILGQLAASALTWAATLALTVRYTHQTISRYLTDLAPYCAITAIAMAGIYVSGQIFDTPWCSLIVQCVAGAVIYIGINMIFGSRIQREALGYIRGRGIQ